MGYVCMYVQLLGGLPFFGYFSYWDIYNNTRQQAVAPSTSHYSDPQHCFVGLTVVCGMFSTFSLIVRNFSQNIVNPIEQRYWI